MHEFAYLAVNLRFFRHVCGVSQRELATAAHLSQSYVSDLERGLRPRDIEDVDAVAVALHVSRRVLLRKPKRVRRTTHLQAIELVA